MQPTAALSSLRRIGVELAIAAHDSAGQSRAPSLPFSHQHRTPDSTVRRCLIASNAPALLPTNGKPEHKYERTQEYGGGWARI